ncbi:helix-turn-helix domain-containing protein [Flavobacterium tructae]|uniref:helix-turn-helix domain-containing protein n=1 Tax=Flavobacterium tructae TaxID=1114873 RepID=UPI0035A86A2B
MKSNIRNNFCNPSGLHNIMKFCENCSMAELSKEDIIFKNKMAQRIETLRLKTGLTQSKFAEKHDIERQTISRWESQRTKRGVTIHTVRKFCNMINISLSDFFDSSEF